MSDNQTPPPAQPDGEHGETPWTYDAWLTEQPDAVKTGLSQHFEQQTANLKSALADERDQRKTFQRQLKEAISKLEEGSETRANLETINQQLADRETRLAFYDAAISADVDPKALKLAYLAAKEGGHISDRGKIDFDALKVEYPHLFVKPAPQPRGDAGSGRETPATTDPNNWLRAKLLK